MNSDEMKRETVNGIVGWNEVKHKRRNEVKLRELKHKRRFGGRGVVLIMVSYRVMGMSLECDQFTRFPHLASPIVQRKNRELATEALRLSDASL